MTTAEILEPLSADTERRIERVRTLATLLDTLIGLPGTRFRLGLDGIIGLVPGIGDGASALLSLWIVHEARAMGLPKAKLARMLANIAIDTAVGAVPVLGDIFDVVWKSNRKNMAIIDEHFGTAPNRYRTS
jgi:hypothetical protein